MFSRKGGMMKFSPRRTTAIWIQVKGSAEGSSEPEFRSSILCDVIEISG